MIWCRSENDRLEVFAETRDYSVYLDNWAIIDLAKRCPLRRQRFVKALRSGGTLLFSWANSVEIAGPQGSSADAVRAFLDSIGPHWVPLESDPWKVAQREQSGVTYGAVVSRRFMEAYFHERANDLSQPSKVLDLSTESFFRLSAVLDWVQKDRDEIREDGSNLDRELRDLLKQGRTEYERDRKFLDRMWPPIPFDSNRPATFVMFHLLRLLVVEAKESQFKDHDGLDFFHAVPAAAYGCLSTLDKQWKRRVEKLPKPNLLAKVYYRPEVDELVNVLESLVVSNNRPSGSG